MINLDKVSKLCTIKGKIIPLTKTEFLLLSFLMDNAGQVFSREEIANNVWNRHINAKTVDVNIGRLRKKLGSYSKNIDTRNGFGYCFTYDEERNNNNSSI